MRCAWMPFSASAISFTTRRRSDLGSGPAASSACSVPPGTYSSSSYAAPSDTPWSSTRTTVSPTEPARIARSLKSGAMPRRYNLTTRRSPERTSATSRMSASPPAGNTSTTRNASRSAAGSGRAPAIAVVARIGRLQYTHRTCPGGFGCAQSACGQSAGDASVTGLSGAVEGSAPASGASATGAVRSVVGAAGSSAEPSPAARAAGAGATSAGSGLSEKSTFASSAPHGHRLRSGGFSRSQTGQRRTYVWATRRLYLRHDTCVRASPRLAQSASTASMSPRAGMPIIHTRPPSTDACIRLPASSADRSTCSA